MPWRDVSMTGPRVRVVQPDGTSMSVVPRAIRAVPVCEETAEKMLGWVDRLRTPFEHRTVRAEILAVLAEREAVLAEIASEEGGQP